MLFKQSRSLYLNLLLFSLFFLTACGGGGGSTSATNSSTITGPYGVLSGTILDPTNNAPVEGAIVSLNMAIDQPTITASVKRSINKAPLAMTLTNGAGYYEFRQVTPGTYNLSVTKDGRFGATFSSVVRQGEVTTDPGVVLTPVLDIVGTVRINTSIQDTNNMPQILIWLLGTSLGTIPEPLPQTDPNWRDFKFTISNVPVKSTAYTLHYFAENHLAQNISIILSPTAIPANFTYQLNPVTLTVDPATQIVANRKPTAILTISDSTISSGGSITLNGASSSDPDNDPITYHWNQTAGSPLVFTGASTQQTLTLTQAGTYTFMLFVTDDHENTSLPVFASVTVLGNSNTPPLATALASINGGVANPLVTATITDTITLNAAGSTDPEGATLTWRWVQTGGPSVTFNSGGIGETTLANDTFNPTQYGTYRFALVVNDGVYNSNPAYVTIEVPAPVLQSNNPPTAVATVTPSSEVVGNTVTLDSSASSDPENIPLNYSWTQIAGPTATVSSLTAAQPVATINGIGLHIFQLKVSDGVHTSLPVLVSFTGISPVNNPPVAVATIEDAGSPVTAAVINTLLTLTGTASNDPESTPLTYQWSQIAGPLSTITNSTLASAMVTPTTAGVYSFQLRVSDGIYSDTTYALIDVSPSTVIRPLAVATTATPTVFAGASVTLDASSSSDSNSLPLSYVWTQIVGTPVVLSDNTASTPSFTATIPGTYTFELTVNNGVIDSLPQYVSIKINAPINQIPTVITITTDGGTPVNVVQPGTTVLLDASGSTDSDNGPSPLTFLWEQINGPSVSIATPTNATGSAILAQSGHYTFKVTVTDGADSVEVVVLVTVNSMPVAILTAPATALLNTAISLSAVSSHDADGDSLTYNWTQIGTTPEVITFASGGTGVSDSFTPAALGIYQLQLIVNDGTMSSLASQFQVDVTAPNFVPSLVTVTENTPGSNDTVNGLSGAVSGSGYTIRAFTDSSLTQPLLLPGPTVVEAVSGVDGSFTLNLGDNNNNIRNDLFYIAIVGGNTRGPGLQLINDITPPTPPSIDRVASDKTINNMNKSAFTIAGTTEPDANVFISIRSLSPVTTVSFPVTQANASTGVFTATDTVQILPDGEVVVELRVADVSGNTSYNYPVFNTIKDVIPPTINVITPVNNGFCKLNPTLEYELSENIVELDATFTDTSDSSTYSLITNNPDYLGVGNHKQSAIVLDSPLIDNNNYNLTTTVQDAAGNVGSITVNNITADATAPSGATVSLPTPGGWTTAANPSVAFDLTAISETLARGYIEVVQDGGSFDPNVPMQYQLPAGNLSAGPQSVTAVFPASLQSSSTYTFNIVLLDNVENSQLLTVAGVQVADTSPNAELTLLKPRPGDKITDNPKLSYTLAENITNLHFELQQVSGTGPASTTIIFSGADSLQGPHPDKIFSGANLTENDVYNLIVSEQRPDSTLVHLLTIPNLTVDTTPPVLTNATAIQAVFGEWHAGDSILFTFSEAMDTSTLSTTADLAARMPDTSANTYTWFASSIHTLSWSSDQKVLTITLRYDDATAGRLMAMDMGNPLNATFNPDGTVLDAAGNPDNTGTAIQLESVGDTTPPVLTITTPTSTSSMNNTTLLEYNLTENLASGTLKIFYGNLITIGGLPTNSPARAATLHGSWVLDAAARTKGNGKTINLSAVGIPNFENGIIYNFTIEGVDGANNPVVSNVDNVTADLSIPTAPAVGDLRFQNFNGQVICEAEGSIGNTGDKLRFYVNGSFIQEAAYLGPYGELSETTVITGIPTQPAGGIIGYTLIDMAGNESAQSPAGIIPYAPDATDISLLQLSVSISEFTVTANAPGILSQGLMTLGIVFSTDYTNVITTGSTIADGTYTAFSDSIYASDFVAGDVVRYVYIDSFNNCSDWSADDGAIPALDTVTPVLGVANGNINDADSGEAISLNFTRDVTIDVIITTANISTGNTVIINNPYSWAGVLNDINIAPVGVADTSLGTAESLSINTGTGLSHVINLASYYFTPATGTIRVELNPMGTNLIRDTVGGHCTIPSSIISAGGITNGIEATGF